MLVEAEEKKYETCENEDAEHSKHFRTDRFDIDTGQDKNTLNQSQMKN